MFVEMKNPFLPEEDKSRNYLFFGSTEEIMIDSVIAVMRSEERRKSAEKAEREQEKILSAEEEEVEEFPCKKGWRYNSSAHKRNLHHRKDRAKKHNAEWHGTKTYCKQRKSDLQKKETERIDRASAEYDLTWEQAYNNADAFQRIAESIPVHEQELESIYAEMCKLRKALWLLEGKADALQDLIVTKKEIIAETMI